MLRGRWNAIFILCIVQLTQSTTQPTILIESLVRKWAPLVFLAPGERFFPNSVEEFLRKVLPIPLDDNGSEIYNFPLRLLSMGDLPKGRTSESWILVTRESVGSLLQNSSSFLYGKNPKLHSVPVYAMVVPCDLTNDVPVSNDTSDTTIKGRSAGTTYSHFHVTYWMFYPYNQGKAFCTVDMGKFGAWPIPKLNNFCYGAIKEFGNHVGDWEHVSLYFEGSRIPKYMYVSSHDVGATYRLEKGQFKFEKREIRRGILQRPVFPDVIKLSSPSHRPVLFAARGSHGLWPSPGKHRFVRIPRLYDTSGFGVQWHTWKNLKILTYDSTTEMNWLKYRGRWGNPKNNCHPVSSLGIDICELSDGPTGIPSKKVHFQCHQ